MPVDNKQEWTADEIKNVAERLGFLIWVIFFQILAVLLLLTSASLRPTPPTPETSSVGLGLVIAIIRVVIAILSVYGVYRMAKSLRKSVPVLYVAAMFIPFISLLVLLRLNSEASRILQANGIRVGLMGANGEDIECMSRQASTVF